MILVPLLGMIWDAGSCVPEVASAAGPGHELAVPLLRGQPNVDGRIEEAEWEGAAGIFAFRALDSGQMTATQPRVLLGRDGSAFYLAACLPLPGGAAPRHAVTEHDGQVWQDDAVEFFVDPHPQDEVYYQFIVNAGGTTWESRGTDPAYGADWQAAARVEDTAWSLEVRVPYAALQVALPEEGSLWGVNVAWDRQTPSPATLTWAPISSSLHQPQAFRRIRFSAKACPFSIDGFLGPQDGRIELTGRCDVPEPGPARVALEVRRAEGGEGVEVGAAAADVAPGRERPVALAVPLPMEAGSPEAGDYTLRFLLQLTSAGAAPLTCADLTSPFTVAPQLEVAVRKYFLAEAKVVAEVSTPGLQIPRADARLQVRLCANGGDVVTEKAVESLPEEGPVQVEFPTAALDPGEYEVVAVVTDAAGHEVAVASSAFTRPEGPSWLGSPEGLGEEVLAPWTPVQAKGRVVNVWGRSYEFDGLPLPCTIRTAGASILAEPLRVVAVVNGSPQEWKARHTSVSNRQPAAATIRTFAESEALNLAATVRTEYDGMVRSDLVIEPRQPVAIDSLALEVPLKAEHARYLYHFPGRWGSAYNAGALPREGFTSAFRPFVWLGDEDRGLAWFAESDQGFFPLDADDVIEIRRAGDQVLLRIRIIGAARQVTEPLRYTFGMQATPVKPLKPDVWDFRICHHGGYGIQDRPWSATATLTYPAAGHIDLAQGTFEAWVRPHFDPQPNVAPDDPGRGRLNRSLLDVKFPDERQIGFYWNIDDRGMRVYYKLGENQYGLIRGASSNWRAMEWHHVALTWGDRTRVYVDGQMLVDEAHQGTVPGDLSGAEIVLGEGMSEFDIDEIRVSDIPRESFDLARPPSADEHVLLLDHLDARLPERGERRTSPQIGSPPAAAGGQSIAGKFGQGFGRERGEEKMTLLDRLAELGVRTICFHEHWTDIQNYTSTTHGEELHALVRACHERGIRLLLYFGYEISNIAPEWDLYSDECLVFPRGGGYHRQPEQRAYIVCYRSPWQDFMADGIARMMDEYDIDGVYLDGTANPWACANVHHGCGYRRPDGTIGKTYQFFATRGMMRRIYTIVKGRKPDGLVNVHQSTCMTIPTLSWATSYWDGEQFGSIEAGPWALDVLPLEAFRCEFMGRQWGVPAEMLCYNRPYTYRQAMSVSLLHDVLVRGGLGGPLELESKLWHAMQDFGRDQATFIPYWDRARALRTNDRAVKVTAYSRGPRGVVLVVSNLGREATEAQVELDRGKLGIPAGSRLEAQNVEDGAAVPVAGDALSFRLEPLDFRVIHVTLQR